MKLLQRLQMMLLTALLSLTASANHLYTDDDLSVEADETR